MVRKEVPVSLVPARTPLERSFSDVLVVQRTLLLEEQEVHRKAAEAAAGAAAGVAGWVSEGVRASTQAVQHASLRPLGWP